MKKLILSLLLLISISSGKKAFAADDTFNKIDLRGSATINLSQSSAASVSEAMKPDYLFLENGTLVVKGIHSEPLNITVPTISEIRISGTGSIKGDSVMHADDLSFIIDGDGKITLNADAKKINATVNGFGKLTLRGTAESADYNIPGAGKIDASELKVKNCNVNITGMGKCSVDVSDELNSNISGNGVVTYATEPKVINKSISGNGKVKSSNENYNITEKSDTTHFNFGDKQILIVGKKNTEKKKNKINPIWAGLELGINSYMNNDGTFKLNNGKENFDLRTEKSVSVSLNFLEKHVELGHSNIYLFTGLGFTWNNYRFDNDIVLTEGDFTTATHDTTSGVTRLKSKLVASYLMAPVMMEVFTSRNPSKAVHIGVGGMFGLRVGSHTKEKVEVNGDESKIKVHDNFNLSPFRYGFRVAVGYGHFNIFADYYASTLFRDNKGPVLYPVNAGITLVGF